MSRFKGDDAARLDDPSSWDENDVLYLRDRGLLPEGYRLPRSLRASAPSDLSLDEIEVVGDIDTIPDQPPALGNFASGDVNAGRAASGDDDPTFDEDEPEALEDMTKGELESEARARGLSTSGSKAEILERIRSFDAGPS